MKRFHVHVSVPDLGASIRFYSTLFGTEPAVVKSDYAKWMLEDPRVNFAISQRGGKTGVNHLGLQTDSDAELDALNGQLQAGRSGHACRKGNGMLLRTLEQVLGDRPHRHRLGDLPHAGQCPDLQRRGGSCAGRRGLLRPGSGGREGQRARSR